MKRRGFVLVNALVLVAALSVAALALLGRAAEGRFRHESARAGDRMALALGAFEALAIRRLADDPAITDSAADRWAVPVLDLALDPGRVSGRIVDQQGLFNLNWLADPDDRAAHAAFDRLAAAAGVPRSAAEAVAAFLRPGGPPDRDRWLTDAPSRDPVGGAAVMLEQLRDIPGLSGDALDRLAPLVAVLPGDSRLNVNTAPDRVLAAVLPEIATGRRAAILQARRDDPFVDVPAFVHAAGLPVAPPHAAEGAARFEGTRLAVASHWFLATSTVRIDGAVAHRRSLLHRPSQGRVEVAWRMRTAP